MSQNTQILSHLKKRPITPLEALREHNCLRLAARISDLRGQGHKIRTDMIKEGGKRFAQYRLTRK